MDLKAVRNIETYTKWCWQKRTVINTCFIEKRRILSNGTCVSQRDITLTSLSCLVWHVLNKGSSNNLRF